MKQSMILISIVVVAFVISSSFTVVSSMVYPDDGVYEDDLSSLMNIKISSIKNCSFGNGTVEIKNFSDTFTYDFVNSNITAWHRNNLLETFNQFIGPDMFFEEDFNDSQYRDISYMDGKKAVTISSSDMLVPLHHFRFHINVSKEWAKELRLFWNGSFNSDGIRVFVWSYSSSGLYKVGMWKLVADEGEGPVDAVVTDNVQRYISKDGYVDFIVVPYRAYESNRTCISTDYVSLSVDVGGHYPVATFDTYSINPSSIWRWEYLVWDGNVPSGTRIICQILDGNENLINDTVLRGNKEGFVSSYVSLSSLSPNKYEKLSVRFYLETDNPSFTPKLTDYAMLWQTDNKKWKDEFSTDFRIETKSNDSIVSRPIYLPSGYWWDKFYAEKNISDGEDISFDILDINNKVLIKNVNLDGGDMSHICSKVIKLKAHFIRNNTQNPRLIEWHITFSPENDKPRFSDTSLRYVNSIESDFTVKARDLSSGLCSSSAKYMLSYMINGSTRPSLYSNWISTSCTGINCTKDWQMITAKDVPMFYSSKLNNIMSVGNRNITLYSIAFYIDDMAGNYNITSYRVFFDRTAPTSHIEETANTIGYIHNGGIDLHAQAHDDKSGVSKVELYYMFSSDNLSFSQPHLYKVDLEPPWNWTFIPQDSGYYRFYSLAVDNAGNIEPSKENQNDLLMSIIDINPPEEPSFYHSLHWLHSRNISFVTFRDDFIISSIKYSVRDGNKSIGIWRDLAVDVDSSTYNHPWNIDTIDWERMESGKQYYIYFNVTDIAGNRYVTNNNDEALLISKDLRYPSAHLDEMHTWQWQIPFNITSYIMDDGSGIRQISLYYRHSLDNLTWSEWTLYNTTLFDTPISNIDYTWTFNASDGDGYYEFYEGVVDVAGLQKDSNYISVGITVFPGISFIVFVGLFLLLFFMTIIAVKIWKTH